MRKGRQGREMEHLTETDSALGTQDSAFRLHHFLQSAPETQRPSGTKTLQILLCASHGLDVADVVESARVGLQSVDERLDNRRRLGPLDRVVGSKAGPLGPPNERFQGTRY